MGINEDLEKNKTLVKNVIWNNFPSMVGDEDLFQVGLIALWQAMKSYDPEEASFETYASRVIKYSLISEVKHRGRSKRSASGKMMIVSMNETIKGTDGLTIGDSIAEEDDIASFRDVKDFLSGLDKMERKIVQNKSKGMSDQKIAEILKLHQTSVSRKLKNIKKRMTEECL